ncbi:MAG: GtrA family protein [Kiritimatiellia bacterium]
MKVDPKYVGLVQFVKYGMSGVVATAVHLVVFYAMAIAVFPALTPVDPFFKIPGMAAFAPVGETLFRLRNVVLSNSVAFVISNLSAYLLNIFFVFKAGRHHRVLEIALFYLVSGVSWFIGTLLQAWLIAHFDLSTTVATGAYMATSLLINFVLRKYFIFKG